MLPLESKNLQTNNYGAISIEKRKKTIIMKYKSEKIEESK